MIDLLKRLSSIRLVLVTFIFITLLIYYYQYIQQNKSYYAHTISSKEIRVTVRCEISKQNIIDWGLDIVTHCPFPHSNILILKLSNSPFTFLYGTPQQFPPDIVLGSEYQYYTWTKNSYTKLLHQDLRDATLLLSCTGETNLLGLEEAITDLEFKCKEKLHE